MLCRYCLALAFAFSLCVLKNPKGEEFRVIPRYLKATTLSSEKSSWSSLLSKVVFPVAELWLMTFDFLTESSKWWFLKKVLAMAMRWSRLALFLPRIVISSAKNIAAMLMFAKGTPRLVLLSSRPRSLIKMEKSSGDKLQPIREW